MAIELTVQDSTDGVDVTVQDSGATSRANISDSGTAVVADVTDIDFATDLDVTDDGDGSVTVDASASAGTSVAVEDDDSAVVDPVDTLDFAGSDFDATNPSGSEAKVVLTNDSITLSGGDGLKNGSTAALGGSFSLDVEPADFAGSGLADDGSDNLEQAPVPSPETVDLGGADGSVSPTDKRVNPLTVLVDAGGSASAVQGIDGVATHGQEVILQQTGGENVTLEHNNGSASNPLLNTSGGDETLDANDELTKYVYDGANWRQLGSNIQ